MFVFNFFPFITQMGDIEQLTTDLRQQLEDMPKNIRLFSSSVRSLYAQNAVAKTAQASQKFSKLRDDTRNDAMVYLKGILPLSTKFVSSISDFFDFYEALNFQEWCEKLSSIHEETVGYKQLCEALLKMHTDILVPLKKRQDQARVVIVECKDLQEKFESKRREYEKSGQTNQAWGIGLSLLFPPVGDHFREKANDDFAEADAHGTKAEIQGAAVIAIRDTLIPALEHFVEGITKAAGFFSVMEQEIGKFEGKAEKGMDSAKPLHYKVMRREAQDMKSICQTFSAALPAVKSDFEAICSEGTDQDYVERCLEEHRGTIRETCTTSNLASSLMAVTAGGIGNVFMSAGTLGCLVNQNMVSAAVGKGASIGRVEARRPETPFAALTKLFL